MTTKHTVQVTGPDKSHMVTGLDMTHYRFRQKTRHNTMKTKDNVQVTRPDKSHMVTGLDKTHYRFRQKTHNKMTTKHTVQVMGLDKDTWLQDWTRHITGLDKRQDTIQ